MGFDRYNICASMVGGEMMYIAQNVDTDKALNAIEEARRVQEIQNTREIAEKRAFMEGVNKGLDIARSIFECRNYEKEVE